ncbi:putative hydrolase of the HAD superfamily [Spiroplasma tabanidicola]|uniref:Putative hydrolase of the HAD superfamily n=2 Tax=Spiroplasma tabanidicola TaxID=324079 RepID=A0A6I6CIZ0_9MOLU|nr:putative hydrolase of the HAD superfamily [Spiroplasma tabanidicola]
MIKSIYKLLRETGCYNIDFYEPQDAQFQARNEIRTIKDIYRITFTNSNHKIINLYLVFNEKDFLYKADNKNTKSLELNVVSKEQQEIEELINLYTSKDSNMGLTNMKLSLQSSPIRFIDSLDQKEINIYVEILKYENLFAQSSTLSDYMYFNNFVNFYEEFLPIFL